MSWDYEVDVLVAGYGGAGSVAAISAHDAGARVLIVEKASHPGGMTVLAGGGVIVADNFDKAYEYLRASCGGRTPDDVLKRFAEGLVTLPDYVQELVQTVGLNAQFVGYGTKDDFQSATDKLAKLDQTVVNEGGTYPLPGYETFYTVKVDRFDGFTPFPYARGQRAGARLWKALDANVEKRNIEVWYRAPLHDLITDGSGSVIGAVIDRNGQEFRVRTLGGVVLATGGFENALDLKYGFLEVPEVHTVCSLRNTGDGIRIAQRVGAALWHMWFFHGGYGVKLPHLPFACFNQFRGPRNPNRQMPWILVDKRAARFMDEYPPDVSDTSVRFLQQLDPDRVDFPRIPSFLIYDEDGRQIGPIAGFAANDEEVLSDPSVPEGWSADNLAEVDKGWVKAAATIEALAVQLGLDPQRLVGTVLRWNEMCARGDDLDFGRKCGTMVPISTPPFYGVEVRPIVYNTQGGPVHDSKQRVLDAFGRPIGGLYAAGELGSLFGHLYLSGGNISECLIGGRIAGTEAAVRRA